MAQDRLHEDKIDKERFQREVAELKKREEELSRAVGQNSTSKEKFPTSTQAMRYAGIGLEFAAVVFGFVYLGRFLDDKFGSQPWLLLAGISIGFSLALYRLIFVARKLNE